MQRLNWGVTAAALLLCASSLFSASSTVAPVTTNNDDSCDISVAPAATLLLPHFEIDLNKDAATARTTVFNVINVSPSPQIARVTVWTDWAYPAISFSLFLTGYDVEGVDLRELLVRGTVPTRVEAPGPMSRPNFSNPNFKSTIAQDCGSRMPHIPVSVLNEVRRFLSTGRPAGSSLSCTTASGEDTRVGSDHGTDIAVGYVTIDVVASCSPTLPTSPKYFTSELLFDNVLTGDYVHIVPSGEVNGYAGGSPLVHLRAIPEGGAAGSIVPTRLPYTFYDRLTDIDANTPRTIDRRQPLPSTFSARWIDGGENDFQTSYSIWREAVTGPSASCATYSTNGSMPIAELVRFDEHENASVAGMGIVPLLDGQRPGLPATSVVEPYSAFFPVIYTTDFGGWTYLNLNNGGNAQTYSAARDGYGKAEAKGAVHSREVSQNWVVLNMYSEDRYGVSYDAAWLGNGCSPAMPLTKDASAKSAAGRIQPAPNVNP